MTERTLGLRHDHEPRTRPSPHHEHGFSFYKPVKSNRLQKILAKFGTNVSPDCRTTALKKTPRRMNKKDLSERDICTKFITPNLVAAGWNIDAQVREEVGFTDGRIYVRGKIHAVEDQRFLGAEGFGARLLKKETGLSGKKRRGGPSRRWRESWRSC